MLRKFPRERNSRSPGSASTKQQSHNTRPAREKFLPQETIKHVDDCPLSSDADELLHPCLDQPSISEQNSPPTGSCIRPYEDELATLCDAVIGLERELQAACEKNNEPEGRRTNSRVEGVLEKAVSYIRHLQEQQNTLEQESEALRAKLTFWTGEDEIFCRWRSRV